jgi:hypothetical protein
MAAIMTIEPDKLDEAASLTQENTDRAVSNIRVAAKAIDTRNPLGTCWNCGDVTGHERRFCDADCRDDWNRDYE